jgi:hypothetical protein
MDSEIIHILLILGRYRYLKSVKVWSGSGQLDLPLDQVGRGGGGGVFVSSKMMWIQTDKDPQHCLKIAQICKKKTRLRPTQHDKPDCRKGGGYFTAGKSQPLLLTRTKLFCAQPYMNSKCTAAWGYDMYRCLMQDRHYRYHTQFKSSKAGIAKIS